MNNTEKRLLETILDDIAENGASEIILTNWEEMAQSLSDQLRGRGLSVEATIRQTSITLSIKTMRHLR